MTVLGVLHAGGARASAARFGNLYRSGAPEQGLRCFRHEIGQNLTGDVRADRVIPDGPRRGAALPQSFHASCAGLTRASMSWRSLRKKGVDGRVKPGHDDGESIALTYPRHCEER